MTFSLQKTWKKFLKDLLGGIIKCALCTKAVCQTNSLKKKRQPAFYGQVVYKNF